MKSIFSIQRYDILDNSYPCDLIWVPRNIYEYYVKSSEMEKIIVKIIGQKEKKERYGIVEGSVDGEKVIIPRTLQPNEEEVKLELMNLKIVEYISFKPLNEECRLITDIIQVLKQILKFTTIIYQGQELFIPLSEIVNGVRRKKIARLLIEKLGPEEVSYVSHLEKDIKIDFENIYADNYKEENEEDDDEKEKSNEDGLEEDDEDEKHKEIIKGKGNQLQQKEISEEEKQGKKQCEICDQWVSPMNWRIHQQQCKKRYERCEICHISILKEKKEEHKQIHKLSRCEHCGLICELSILEKHMNGSCKQKILVCETCGLSYQENKTTDHNYCCKHSITELTDYITKNIISNIVTQIEEPKKQFQPFFSNSYQQNSFNSFYDYDEPIRIYPKRYTKPQLLPYQRNKPFNQSYQQPYFQRKIQKLEPIEPENDDIIKCFDCGQKMNTEEELLSHLEIVHGYN